MRGYFRTTKLNKNKHLQAYVVGLAIGDDNLSNPNKRATRLRITCDPKYPILLQRIIRAIQSLFPENKVSIVQRKGCVDVSVYSNRLEEILGWHVGKGSKFVQNVSVPNWIKESNDYKINCLKGLIETDGSIYTDRGYRMVMFVTIIHKLAEDVYNMITSLGFSPKLYKIDRQSGLYRSDQQTLYHVRLSKNVAKFLDLVKPEKA